MFLYIFLLIKIYNCSIIKTEIIIPVSYTHLALTSGANNGSTGSTALTINQIPSHEHGVPFRNTSASQSSNYDILDYYAWGKQYIVGSTKATGGGQGHTHTLGNHSHTIPAHSHGLNSHTHTTGTASNLPPYLAVYVWKRTA